MSVSACRFTVILLISVSRNQSVFSAQSNILPYSCPSVPVGVQLSYQFQFHAFSMHSQHNLTPYCTAVRQFLSVYSYLINFSFTPSVCIHSPIQHLTVQLSVSACRCTVILSISVHAVSLYSQPNLTPYRTPVRQCQSVYSYLINFSFTTLVTIHSPN